MVLEQPQSPQVVKGQLERLLEGLSSGRESDLQEALCLALGCSEAWQDGKLMELELRALREFQLKLWPRLWCLWAELLGGGSRVKLPARKGPWMPALMGALAQMA